MLSSAKLYSQWFYNQWSKQPMLLRRMSQQHDPFTSLVNNWLQPPPKMCRSALPSVVAAELLCDDDPDVKLCQGMRRCSTRSFVLPSLPILCFHVHAFLWMECWNLFKIFLLHLLFKVSNYASLLSHFSVLSITVLPFVIVSVNGICMMTRMMCSHTFAILLQFQIEMWTMFCV